MQPLRDYQERGVSEVRAHWSRGMRRVLLVSPTGSGKTRMGEELITPFDCGVWFAHRKELIRDASERLRAALGPLDVGVIAPGFDPSPFARIQVCAVQTALARGVRPPAKVVVLDEAHHFAADDWSQIIAAYPEAVFVLLTATPERQDGRAMGDIADAMVVAAQYSELLAAGHIVNMRAYRPPQILGSNLAQDPAAAWLRYAGLDGVGFAFHPSVETSQRVTAQMRALRINAWEINQKTPAGDRRSIIESMRSGDERLGSRVDVINNVYTMTEGVDVPRARVCMLACAVNHCGGLLQRAGRVLRPHDSKTEALLIDLVGASILHGLPTEDRTYSLSGDPITRTSAVPLRQCLNCGATVHAAYERCPECSYLFPVKARKGPRIYSLDLVEVFAGKDTPAMAKRAEYQALRKIQQTNGYDLYFVLKKYKELFGEATVISDATNSEKRAELAKLRAVAAKRGFKPGYVQVQFKATFGHWPSG